MQINLRKAMFVLPNLFTVSSIFLGFYSMTLSAGDATPEQLYRAALAIFFAIFFDMFDGRVARMTRTQSDFGVQLDSLADVISFGAAPALLVYKWALAPMGFLGLFLSFSFAACGALRLARFNVLAARGDKASHRFFTGLPIPLAAGALVSVVIAHYRHYLGPTEPSAHVPIAVMVALLAFLMVSTVRYRTF
ncbi:MAG: CDP-diacylglycerol--serine O-phosphatidyltransferase, partial [Anaeromyxobacteraceae bacterium]|nr:CDP-diacylglycerol--serine O-phosphatidyltransferase [Anaeromyxobacteraceae bacterium]